MARVGRFRLGKGHSTYCIMKMIDGDLRLVPREAQQL